MEAFEALVRGKLGNMATELLRPTKLRELLQFYERGIERFFNPLDADCESEFELPFMDAPDIPEIGLDGGFLRVSRFFSVWQKLRGRDELRRSVFEPTFTEIVGFVDAKVYDTETNHDTPIKGGLLLSDL